MKSPPRRSRLLFAIAILALAASGTGAAQVQKDREFQECPECPVMVGIPAGTFVMGSPPSEKGRFDSEGPLHDVAIKAFALGKYDVTSAEFLTFLRETGYQPAACSSILDMKWSSPGHGRAYAPFSGEPPHWPAVCLDWHDAEKYIAWLNDKVRAAHPNLDHAKGA
jgi:formylglycine-generating enzyme required for sulfatase activity